MGTNLYWMAVKGADRDVVCDALELRPTGQRYEFPDAGPEHLGIALPRGWYLVVDKKNPLDVNAAEDLSKGTEVLWSWVAEHSLSVGVCGYADGKVQWCVEYGMEVGMEGLEFEVFGNDPDGHNLRAGGALPDCYVKIRDRALAQVTHQGNDDALFEVPTLVGKAMTGYLVGSEVVPRVTEQEPFEILVRRGESTLVEYNLQWLATKGMGRDAVCDALGLRPTGSFVPTPADGLVGLRLQDTYVVFDPRHGINHEWAQAIRSPCYLGWVYETDVASGTQAFVEGLWKWVVTYDPEEKEGDPPGLHVEAAPGVELPAAVIAARDRVLDDPQADPSALGVELYELPVIVMDEMTGFRFDQYPPQDGSAPFEVLEWLPEDASNEDLAQGHIFSNELHVANVEASADFFARLFGLQTEESKSGFVSLITNDDASQFLIQSDTDLQIKGWVPMLAVDVLDESVERALALGARLIRPLEPEDVAAYLRAPDGTPFAVHGARRS